VKQLKDKLQIFITIVFAGFLIWWASFQHVVRDAGVSVQWFGGTYGVMALMGSIIGIIAARKWGGFRSTLGRALMFFSLALFAQEAGQLISTYYVYGQHLSALPYPSWGDVAYFGSTLFYICGGVFMAKAVGVKFSLQSNKYKVVAFMVPAALLAASYWVFLNHHQYNWHSPITVFLDAGYPLGDAIYISMAIIAYLLSVRMLGGIMRTGILILMIALVAQYSADWTFLYQTSRNIAVVGQYFDLLYLMTYFIAATAMIKFLRTYKGLSAKTAKNTNKESAVAGTGA